MVLKVTCNFLMQLTYRIYDSLIAHIFCKSAFVEPEPDPNADEIKKSNYKRTNGKLLPDEP